MTGAVEQLRRVLALERRLKFANTAVMGGLDAYLQRYARDAGLPGGHRFLEVLRLLPPDGYRELHPVQRERVVEELLRAVAAGPPGPRAPAAVAAAGAQTRREPAPAAVAARARPAPPRAPATSSRRPVIGTLDSPLSVFRGVSRTYEAKLSKLGLRTVRDLLFHFPHRYHDYSEVRPIARLALGDEQTVLGTVWSAGETVIGRRRATEAVVGDDSGMLRVIWWGQTHVARRLRSGERLALSGRVTVFRGRLQMENPEFEPLDEESLHTRRLVPVYPSTEGLPQRLLRRLARETVEGFADKLDEPLPQGLRERQALPPAAAALRQVHFPDSHAAAEKARRRFAFEELLYIELGVVRRRREWQAGGGAPRLALPSAVFEGFLRSLPFELTGAQRLAVQEVLSDIGGDIPMSRLLEGDVGSGKTVVAAAALLAAVAGGYQGAIMAPTEILAEQHHRTFALLLQPSGGGETRGPWFQMAGSGFVALQPPYLERPVNVALLTGSLKPSDKAAAQEAIARGETDIVIGTHALVQEGVTFARLGLAVVDEQHRFGVEQRAALREKGLSPHMLVMTATPIPRTLALTVYGDLDISVLDEMPPGRPPVKTARLGPHQRSQAYSFVRKKAQEGRQAYVICPLVEESAAVEAKAAVAEYERLSREVFPDLRLGLLHGRVSSAEKEAVMRAFRDAELDVLVSTAVVEVGIDVPNATVMLVEGADRFGLAQLHQFRGRVRRSSEQAYCLLLSENPSEEARERLRIMEAVDDGFRLAEEDLRIRGPGEYFGTRQSGLPDLKVAKLTDVVLIEQARSEASRLLDEDGELVRPEHAALRARMRELWGRITAEVS
ncbi:MAG TPA: ATP-dependent DNA helicase RecG [Dehalococcoidia bacterium]|nr:ATP-dependent DNA helicase RecG [Dehalococcoidia bacterium]